MDNEAITIAVIQLLLTIGAAAIAIVPALIRMRHEKTKAAAESEGTLTDSAMKMVGAWEERVKSLEGTVQRLDQENEYWRRGCYRLINQLVANGIVPCWDPNGGPASEPGENTNA